MKNQSGFSLLEILMGIGIIGTASLGLMKLLHNYGATVKTSEVDREITNMTNQISKIISSKNGCKATLADTLTKVIPGDSLGTPGTPLQNIRITGTHNYLSAGKKILPQLSLASMTVKLLKENFDAQSGYGSGVIELNFSKNDVQGGKNIIKRIDFYAKFTSLSYYTVLTNDLSIAKESIKQACQQEVGNVAVHVNILKSNLGSHIGECVPESPPALFIQEC